MMSAPDTPRPIEVPYGVLAATSSDAIVTLDDEGRILAASPATERIFGWPVAELIGQPLSRLVPDAHRPPAELAHGASPGPRAALTRGGEHLAVEITLAEFAADGRRLYAGFVHDVSDRTAQQAELARTAAQLEEALGALRARVSEAEEARRAADSANAAKSQFLATMSHELRTPLNAIGGYVELLESGVRGPITAQQREDLQRVSRAQARLLDLVNDVLNFARIETGRIDFDVRQVPVNPVLCGLGPLLDPQLRAKQLAYTCDPGPPTVRVCADQQKLEQILLNLLANAVKFTPPGGSIAISTDTGPDGVRMRVRDTGVGIPPDRLEAVFEPFVQVDASLTRVYGGTGLGLAISQELARGMGGAITVESTLGLGTEFTVTMPSADESCGARRPPTVGELLARDSRVIVRGMLARLRQDPELPSVTQSELEDHTSVLIADVAQLLINLDADRLPASELLRDGARIQEMIVDLHSRQRRRLGWTPALLVREFDALAEEMAAAIRRYAAAGDVSAADDRIALVRALLDEAKAEGLRSLTK